MLPSKFGFNWPCDSGEEAKNRFSRWLPWWPSWISYRQNLSYFLSISHPNASHQVSSQLLFGLGEEAKNRFSRWLPWRPSWISDGQVIFDLQVTLMLPSKFEVNWSFGSGEEAKYRFSR